MSLVVVAVIAILYLLYKWLSKTNYYFEKKGVAYSKPMFLIGNQADMLLRSVSLPEMVNNWYKEFPKEKVSGFFEFTSPAFVVRDPKLLKKLAVRDFDSFADHRMFLDETIDPLFGKALFSLTGQKWRDMRATLSPAFTGSKMRQMFDFVTLVGDQTARTIEKQIKQGGNNAFEFKELSRKFAVDVIATCAFGIEVNSFQNPSNDFHRMAGKVADFGSFSTTLKFIGYFLVPKIMRTLNIKFFDKETTDFFEEAITETMKIRETKGIIRHDLINLLMQAKKGKLTHEKEKGEHIVEGFATVQESNVGKTEVTQIWNDQDLAAQAFIFFFAGFDTISIVISFLAYELMANPECQKKLQDEVDELNATLDGKHVNYEQIQGMKYMDQVVCEVLRKWPPAPTVDRQCVKDYEFDCDDKKFTIEKGKIFYIPIYGIHHDARYFPNPHKFDPERFSIENRSKIDPDTYLPFGLGPRNCIGSRFALMEIKTIVYYFLLAFDFEPTKKTEIPLKLAKNPNQLEAENGVWVGFKPRK